jgi:hypothetical protein
LTRSAPRTSIELRNHLCCRDRSETPLSRLLTKSAKKTGSSALLGGRLRRSLARLSRFQRHHCIIFPIENRSFSERQSAQERHAANRHGRCGGAAASCVQVCRRPLFPEYATARKPTALKRLRQNFGWQPCPPIRWLTRLRAAGSSSPGIHYCATQANFFDPDQTFD